MENVMRLPIESKTLVFLPGGSGEFRPKAVYIDGQRTEGQARDAEGKPVWVNRGARVELFGKVHDDVAIEVASQGEPKVEVSGLLGAAQVVGPLWVSVRARVRGDFGYLSVTVEGRGVVPAGAKGEA